MKSIIIAAILIASITMYACAEEDAGRYRFYTLKSGNNDLAILLDSATGRGRTKYVLSRFPEPEGFDS